MKYLPVEPPLVFDCTNEVGYVICRGSRVGFVVTQRSWVKVRHYEINVVANVLVVVVVVVVGGGYEQET